MFYECKKLKEIKGINNLKPIYVTKMNSMFEKCSELIYLDLSNFKTSNVTDMSFMFIDCHKLKQIKGLNNFNTINVSKMNGMFGNCKELLYLDLTNFDTSNVITMNCMFYGCNNLREIKGINHFNTINVNDLYGIFTECKELKYLDLSSFDTSKVTQMEGMF